jgi:hypothetical protein
MARTSGTVSDAEVGEAVTPDETAEVDREDEAAGAEFRTALHLLLIRLVGRIPDGAGAAGREALFADRAADLAGLLGLVVFHEGLPVLPDEEELIRALLEQFGSDASLITPELVGSLMPSALQLTVEGSPADAQVRQAIQADEDAVGLWACSAGPAYGSPWPSPVRCYVVEASSDEGAMRLDRRLHEPFATGDAGPRIFVIGPGGAQLPDVTMVLDVAPLIWAREPAVEIQLAPVFTELDEDGRPRGAEGPPLTEQERDVVLAYLDSAETILRASEPGADALDEERYAEVPLDLRSDGLWVWSDATGYYLTEHDVRPAAGLVQRAVELAGRPPALDAVAYHRVLEALGSPVEPEDTDASVEAGVEAARGAGQADQQPGKETAAKRASRRRAPSQGSKPRDKD